MHGSPDTAFQQLYINAVALLHFLYLFEPVRRHFSKSYKAKASSALRCVRIRSPGIFETCTV
jgi:multisubunit Na+/H+ antiporter MnhB subunit